MTTTLAFDIYGTLIDTQGIATALTTHVGEQAPLFAQLWREKQLEYTFRRGLMGVYEDFGICTRQALDYTCDRLQIPMAPKTQDALMDQYRSLSAFDDVSAGLNQLRQAGYPMFAFSNGLARDVQNLLEHAGIYDYFQGVVSVDEVKSFKPDPAVYAHFLRSANSEPTDTWLISSNPFDVIGALSAGWRAAWVRRDERAVFDPWNVKPTMVVKTIGELSAVVEN
jgi:2-haloacid dehalogenase